MSATPLLRPADGIPEVAHTPAGFHHAAQQIAAGRGPIAIDTERASDYRFDDRAFLIQLRRRDAGTVLIAPEADRGACTDALAPVINGQEWVLHAAPSDLPSLQLLGLHPGNLFDTELAGRLLGLPKVNLAALTEHTLGVQLEKNHGNEDWSQWPLPESWRNYAALDVELLLELAEVLAELLDDAGKLTWLEQECAHIMRSVTIPEPQWSDMKGIGRLKTSEQLMVAKALWERRQQIARESDRAPHKVLATKALVELAYTLPTSRQQIRSVLGRRSNTSQVTRLSRVLGKARATPKPQWPSKPRIDPNDFPAPRSQWKSGFPEAQEALDRCRELLSELSATCHTPVENLLQPAVLRHLVWDVTVTRKLTTSADVAQYLAEKGARQWQRELTTPLLASALF
ncbi:HRDC domain-containing protein [Corynebacterium hindlerae]|uniref:HRDC domain-containing protein n=1 Tax=Corynebacterium hindlerae TaxID=699041 RepID=UPI003AAAA45C